MNKKKILCGIAILAIAAVAAWNVNLNAQKSDLSDIALANVEALAQENEDGNRVGTAGYITQRDLGRETIYHDGHIVNCQKLGVECGDTGSLECPQYSIAYIDCHSI